MSEDILITNPAFSNMADEDVAGAAQKGDSLATEYIIKKYKNLVKSRARTYFLIGADKEDIVQEGMIGLFKAIRDFKPDKTSSFKAFAELCITRQIITAIKTATRQKHIPLNSYISLNKPVFDEDTEQTLLDTLSEKKVFDPEEIMITKEHFSDLREKMSKNLSKLEWNVLSLYLDGKSYTEIAKRINKSEKSIDNALQRIKRKVSKFF
ncbi:MAG: RNA polymerase sporulation sigma factor SigH [Ruminococcaceae bacterium]|nr:RNA polymerase sporulation sigma factor SigH [Oscillospiraceae bacterium]